MPRFWDDEALSAVSDVSTACVYKKVIQKIYYMAKLCAT